MAGEVFKEHIEPFLALAAADDLADAGNQHVHRGDGAAVVVEAHVERFDLLGVVEDGDGFLEMHLGEPALVLGLQVETVIHRILERCAALFEQLHGFRVADALKWPGGHELEPLAQALVHELFEDRQITFMVLQHLGTEEFHQCLGEVHVPGEIAEGDFRLDHPELGGMAAGVGVFRAEGGAEGVDVRQGAGESLAFKLAGNGQERALAEEVLRLAGDLVVRQRGYSEHLARALAIAGSDDGGVDVDEIPLLEEPVDGIGHAAAGAEHRAIEVGAWPQMSDATQELGTVPFLLQGIVIGRAA